VRDARAPVGGGALGAFRVRRRHLLLGGAGMLALPALGPVHAAVPTRIILSVPGPGASVGVPLELATRLGFDRDEGVSLTLKFVDGGGVAITDLRNNVSAFAVFGMPAAMSANVAGAGLVALAAVDDLPLYTLVVRSDLRRTIRRIADLKGCTIGVFASSLSSKATAQHVAEMLLRTHGISPGDVNFIAAGQSWQPQASSLRSRLVEATLCDEPIGMRLESEGLGFQLFSLGNPEQAATLPGGRFLRAALIARRDYVESNVDVAARVTRAVTRALRWMASHTPVEAADVLALSGDERKYFLDAALRYPRQYSATGQFSRGQLAETSRFFRGLAPADPKFQAFGIESMIDFRWSGYGS
jgi:NitT/TauT family transport system substrate-binding protein